MKKTTLYLGAVVALIVIIGFFVLSNTGTGEAKTIGTPSNSGNVQVVKMHVEGAQYIFEPSTVKKGIPVRLEADISRMPGCSKSIVISDYGIRKGLSTNDNTIEFTPDKTGSIYIACSMNMYKGTLTVL